MECVGTGKQFRFNGTVFVRTPEMILQCGTWGFVTNCIRVVNSEDYVVPPTFVADHVNPETVVEVID